MKIKQLISGIVATLAITATLCGCSSPEDKVKSYIKENNIQGEITQSYEYDNYNTYELKDDLGDEDDSTYIKYRVSYFPTEDMFVCSYDDEYADYIAKSIESKMNMLSQEYGGVTVRVSADVITIGSFPDDAEDKTSELKEKIFQAMRDADFKGRLKGREYEIHYGDGWAYSSHKIDFV